MEHLTPEIDAILTERFGSDSILALSTVADGIPYVRYVNAFYIDGSFYILTHAHSRKMTQIAANPTVALAGDWFTAHGHAASLGAFCRKENHTIAEAMRTAFAAWIDNGHSSLADPDTIILRVTLTRGTLFKHGQRYDIDTSET